MLGFIHICKWDKQGKVQFLYKSIDLIGKGQTGLGLVPDYILANVKWNTGIATPVNDIHPSTAHARSTIAVLEVLTGNCHRRRAMGNIGEDKVEVR